LYSVAGVAILI
jgi:exonuclease III